MLHELEVWTRFIALLLAIVIAALQAVEAYDHRQWRSALASCTVIVLLVVVVVTTVVVR